MVLSLSFTEMHRTDHGYVHSGMRLAVGILGSVTCGDSNSFCRAQPDKQHKKQPQLFSSFCSHDLYKFVETAISYSITHILTHLSHSTPSYTTLMFSNIILKCSSLWLFYNDDSCSHLKAKV